VARQQRRRANGEGSVFYDTTKGTWVGQIELDPNASGRRVRRKFHAPTAAEARAKLTTLQAAQAAGQDLSQHTATVSQLIALWLARGLPATVTDTTRDNYTTLLTRHVQPALGTRKATTLTPDHIEALLDTMAHAGYSARTMRLNRPGFSGGRVLPAAGAVGGCCDGSSPVRPRPGSGSRSRSAAGCG
jgi:hypothetical protein